MTENSSRTPAVPPLTLNRHPHLRRCVIASVLAFLGVLLGTTSGVQSETLYDVTIIDQPAGAFISTPRAVNLNGEVVGLSHFSPAYIKPWRWTANSGTTLLPTPPGNPTRSAPYDINDLGVISGDGAYDTGVAWKFTSPSAYGMLGTLPGFNASRNPRMNSQGDVVGELFDQNSVLVPTQGFKWTAAGGMTRLFPTAGNSTAVDINDAGVILAVRQGIGVLLNSEGVETPLPVPAPYAYARGASLNSSGDAAGILACTHECNRAFLYTQDGSMILIPAVATRHSVAGISDDRTVVGGVTQGVARGWRWTAQRGTELLQDLIDPGLNIQIWDAYGVNSAGQIVASGADLDESINYRRMMLLTPISETIAADIDGDGDVDMIDTGLFIGVLTGENANPLFVARCNLNGDGLVDGGDVSAFVAAFLPH